METLTGDRVIINVVTLVAASMVEEIRLAIMALHFSGGGSRCRMMEIGVHSRRRGHVGGRGHSWRCTWQQFLGVTYGRENEKKKQTGRREIHLDMRSRRASSTVSSRRIGRARNALETVDHLAWGKVFVTPKNRVP